MVVNNRTHNLFSHILTSILLYPTTTKDITFFFFFFLIIKRISVLSYGNNEMNYPLRKQASEGKIVTKGQEKVTDWFLVVFGKCSSSSTMKFV